PVASPACVRCTTKAASRDGVPSVLKVFAMPPGIAPGRAWNPNGTPSEVQFPRRSCCSPKNMKVGERYIIAKQFLTYQELFGLVAAKGGHKPPKQMPLSVAYAAAWIGEHLAKLLRRKDYLIRTDAVFLSVAFRELDSTKGSQRSALETASVRRDGER